MTAISQTPNSVIVVSGLPRSGTSMMMSMLEAGGIEILSDGLRAPDEDNPLGYYELEVVKTLRQQRDFAWLAGANGKAVKIISSLLKHLPPLFSYDVVFMNRDLDEVILSQRKMLLRRGEAAASQDEGRIKLLFQRHLAQVRTWLLRQANFRFIEVTYGEALENPEYEVTRIETFLRRPVCTERMVERIRRDLHRSQA